MGRKAELCVWRVARIYVWWWMVMDVFFSWRSRWIIIPISLKRRERLKKTTQHSVAEQHHNPEFLTTNPVPRLRISVWVPRLLVGTFWREVISFTLVFVLPKYLLCQTNDMDHLCNWISICVQENKGTGDFHMRIAWQGQCCSNLKCWWSCEIAVSELSFLGGGPETCHF